MSSKLDRPLSSNAVVYVDMEDDDPFSLSLRKGDVPAEAVQTWMRRHLGSDAELISRGREGSFTAKFRSKWGPDKGQFVSVPTKLELEMRKNAARRRSSKGKKLFTKAKAKNASLRAMKTALHYLSEDMRREGVNEQEEHQVLLDLEPELVDLINATTLLLQTVRIT